MQPRGGKQRDPRMIDSNESATRIAILGGKYEWTGIKFATGGGVHLRFECKRAPVNANFEKLSHLVALCQLWRYKLRK